ncbi:glycosyltransferase family 2 protein [Sulfobacillus harzensis]|uniref:Glycosyltransferase n=1 Tax=Sulfobacillus harzensis TaxID=2729629 RepID=A0A7Y0L5Z9_9FIRM|nr:glycosyltransferase [Sulfobacillus harzensis]NMP23948.1 glycosyltransferase [Sulfobacillus harzensis]
MTPEASIIIPTRNRAKLLEQALRSALNQDCSSFEIVVADDASTDATPELLAVIDDPRVRAYRLTEKVSMQCNIWMALSMARGTYGVILSDDDLLEPEFLTHGLRVLRASKTPTFFISNYAHIDGDGNPMPDHGEVVGEGLYADPNFFLKRNMIPPCAALFPIEAIRSLGFVDNILFDWTWWNALCLSGLRVYVTDTRLAAYRIHSASVTGTTCESEWAQAVRDMYRLLLNRFGNNHELTRLYERAEARCQYWKSREQEELWSFLAYGFQHPSLEVLKLALMRWMPLDTINLMRHVLGRDTPRANQPSRREEERHETVLS